MITLNIEMPTNCYSCWVRKNLGCKIANESGWRMDKRDENCPFGEYNGGKK